MSTDYPPEMQRIVDRIAHDWPPILDVSPGWYPLLARLDTRLAALAPNYVVHQCKSKFGALCFYAAPSEEPWDHDPTFSEAIRAAEWESTGACEVCGSTARQYVLRLWVHTLCDQHAADARHTLEQ